MIKFLKKAILTTVYLLLCANAYAQVEPQRGNAGSDVPYSFAEARDWEGTDDKNRFIRFSPDMDGILTELVLKDLSSIETLEAANELVNAFNNRTSPASQGAPKPVSGPGWQGLLQSQTTAAGMHEYQLVAKAEDRTLVFYLASPPDVPAERIQALEHVILSLKVGQRADAPPAAH